MNDIPDIFKRNPKPRWPDRTRRAYEAINLHYQALGNEASGKWVAVRMSDGGSDNILYDTKDQAVHFQLHMHQCMYVCLPPSGQMTMAEIHRLFELNEHADREERENPHLQIRLPIRGA